MNQKFLKTVTVTGADDKTNIMDMLEISKKYPFVEWGILLSANVIGKPRFPSIRWLAYLAYIAGHKIPKDITSFNLSGHLCGRWVSDLCRGECTFLSLNPTIKNTFDRLQINFHGLQHDITDGFFGCLQNEQLSHIQFIFQIDGTNDKHLDAAIEREINAVPLFDTSGGGGKLTDKWPEAKWNYCGYAGGLSPDNVSEQLNKIAEASNGKPIWIDAETHLHSNDDELFDLEKVVKFLEATKEWVI
jgi:hypothetical protein